MDIIRSMISNSERKPLPPNDELGFGRLRGTHMFEMNYHDGEGWFSPKILPYQQIPLFPGAKILNYGQGVFEGMKAFKWQDGDVYLFRPEENAKRFDTSSDMIVIPRLPERAYLEAITELIKVDKTDVPLGDGVSMYIRPLVIGTEDSLGVAPSSTYSFYVFTSPSGSYFKNGFAPIPIWFTDEHSRVAPKGTGQAKYVGNYGASLYAKKIAEDEHGCKQVLYLDDVHDPYLGEVGAANFWLIRKEGSENILETSPLTTGNILAGVTRDSVLKLAPELGFEAREAQITIDDLTIGIKDGTIKELFATGTAASITPIGPLVVGEERLTIGDGEPGPLTVQLYEELIGIQYGQKEDKFDWMRKVI